MVTRRPLELRLVHLNTQEYAEDKAWAVFDKVLCCKLVSFWSGLGVFCVQMSNAYI